MEHEFLVVANANAGSSEAERLDRGCAVLREAGDVVVERTEGSDELERVLERAERRTVVVAGGDGSVHAVVNRLHRLGLLARRPLGLLPMGTGNDLARGLGLPLEPEAAARVVSGGRSRSLDLVEADDGRVFVNAAHAGIGAAAARRATGLKAVLGPVAYLAGAVLAGVREAGWDFSVSVDGAAVDGDGKVLLAVVANGPSIGGGTPVCPAARPDDGVLDVVVVRAAGPLARIGFGLALRRGTHLGRDDVTVARGTVVCMRGEPVGHDVDGELHEDVSLRTYTLRPAAWSLLVP